MSSWDKFINAWFDWCVEILIKGAHLLGISYNEINIWIFCIIEPVVFLLMLAVIVWQWRKIKNFESR